MRIATLETKCVTCKTPLFVECEDQIGDQECIKCDPTLGIAYVMHMIDDPRFELVTRNGVTGIKPRLRKSPYIYSGVDMKQDRVKHKVKDVREAIKNKNVVTSIQRQRAGSSYEVATPTKVILYSYSTPVAVKTKSGKFYQTATKYSATTSKHTRQWLGKYDCPATQTVSQEKIWQLIGE